MNTEEQILNVARSLGVIADEAALLQFATDMKAVALIDFAQWCRTGDPHERISWVDAAINAELMASEMDTVTIGA